MKFILLVIFLFLQFGCTRLQTLNLKPHYYSERPSNIIWIQLAGFTDQHIPLLRFDNPDANSHTQFETADCLGKMWSFNLFELRPNAAASFLSQATGSKNMKGICEDFSRKPMWSYLEEIGYKTTILENGASNNESLEKFLTCQNSQSIYMKNVNLVRMGPESRIGVNSFHYQDPQGVPVGLSYDRSCQNGNCYSTIYNNAKALMTGLGPSITGASSHFYLLRDFTYLKALRKKDLSYAKEVLQDIDKLLSWVESLKRSDTLVIITGAEGLELDFPKEGKEWSEFERLGKNMNIRNSTLLSSVFAKGPMAENFCGLFDESEMIKRILYKPVGKNFSWDALNPISN
jgi:hypothetical protein